MAPARQAAVDIGHQFGLTGVDPLLVQETNNTVVWLRPHAVIAKVGTRPVSATELVREYDVARALVALGAPVAEPFAGSTPVLHPATGFMVTLWHRLEHKPNAEAPAAMVGDSLRRLHGLLSELTVELPDFRVELQRARRVLADETRFAAYTRADLNLLREVFDSLLPELASWRFHPRPLHGEPHDGNRLLTPAGIRWIDFESACIGPVEWDLAFLPDEAREGFDSVDEDLLGRLSPLNSARVATWCGIAARFPEMRRHGQHHLEVLRESWSG